MNCFEKWLREQMAGWEFTKDVTPQKFASFAPDIQAFLNEMDQLRKWKRKFCILAETTEQTEPLDMLERMLRRLTDLYDEIADAKHS